MARVDLTVMGAGVFGLACAYAALRRGATVRVIEAVAVGAGSSGGLVGALSPHVPENWNPKKAFQLESLLMAADWWGQVEATARSDHRFVAGGIGAGYARTGRLQPLADAQAVALAHQRSKTAADLWQGQAEWRVIAATGAAWEPVSPSGYLVHDTLSARINPHRACAVLATAVRALGGEVLCNKDAFGVVLDAQPRGLDTGGAVLWATGLAGLDALSQDLGRSVGNGVKGQALALGHNALHAPQLFVDGLHVVPHADGTVAIGSTSEHRYDDPVSTDAQLDALHARAIAALPILATAPVVARWAAVRPRAVSRAPLLGAWPGREGVAGPKGVYVANGGFKIGFGIAPKVAEVMADLILEGRDTIPQGFGF